MKSRFSKIAMSIAAVAMIVLLSGCTHNIEVTIKTPGEFKLGGISKLAIVKFNSLQDDASVGAYSADEETVRIMQSMVASAFSYGNTYKVTNLENENAISDAAGAGRTALLSTMNNRFDAIMYGRVWWQIAPEEQGIYPMLFSALKEWVNKPYTIEVLGQRVDQTKAVTTKTRDAVGNLAYRSQKASLMLSLSIYRLDASGMVSKVVETYSVASQSACLDNGVIKNVTNLIGADNAGRTAEMQKANKKTGSVLNFNSILGNDSKKAETDSKFTATKNTRTIPSSLQMKCEMANSLVKELAKKLQPTNVVFEIPNKFSDKKITYLLQDNAFLAGLSYSEFAFLRNLRDGYKADKVQAILDEKAKILDDMNISEAYAKSSKLFKKAAEDNHEYIYTSGICEEGLGHFEKALYAYRLAFEVKPEFKSAMGISRCLFAMDMAECVKETNKELRKAEKKAGLQ